MQGQGLSGPAPVITWNNTQIVVDGVPGPDLEGQEGPASTVPGPPPTVAWSGDQLVVGGVTGPSLTGPASTVPGPAGPTAFGLSVSSPRVITVGAKNGVMPLAYPLTLSRFRIASDVATTATVRVWRQVGGEVTGSVLPTLTNATSATGTTLTGWDTTLEVGQVLYMEVVSNSAATHLTLILEGA